MGIVADMAQIGFEVKGYEEVGRMVGVGGNIAAVTNSSSNSQPRLTFSSRHLD